MKALLAICSALFGAWFWQQSAAPRQERTWPAAMPVFAAPAAVNFSSSLRNGTGLVNLLVADPAEQVLAAASRAYAEAGWAQSPIQARDTRIFTRDGAIAVVLAQPTPEGTRVTAIQRPRGL